MHSLDFRFLFVAMILSLSIQTTLSLVGKQFMVEKNRIANSGIIEGGWKFIKSKTVTYTECLVSCCISKYKRIWLLPHSYEWKSILIHFDVTHIFRLNAWKMTSVLDMFSKSQKKMSPLTKIAIFLMTTLTYLPIMIRQLKDGHCINASAA